MKDVYTTRIPKETPALVPQFEDMDVKLILRPQRYVGQLTQADYEELLEEIKQLINNHRTLYRLVDVVPLYCYPSYQCKFCKHYFDAEDKEELSKPTCCDKAIDTWDAERKDEMWKEES